MAAPQITIVGNLTGDPELRIGGSGTGWVSFTVASTQWKRNGDAWEEAGTSFYDVKAFKNLAENFTESLQKGDKVIVLGKIAQESWEKDGEKRSKMALTADEIGPALSKSAVDVQRISYTRADEEPF